MPTELDDERVDSESTETSQHFYMPARIDLTLEGRAKNTDVVDLMKARMPDPTILDEEGVSAVTWSAIASNNQPDSYGTIMMPSTLRLYAEDAEAGVPFQDSHMKTGQERNLGRTFGGRFIGANGNGQARTVVDAYTILGLSPQIDQWWNRARAGLMTDVSVGFYFTRDSRIVCSICHLDMLRDWDCTHWPLEEYEIVDSKGNKTGETRVAFGQVEKARLGELSSVYKGSTPGAAIFEMKAMRAADSGEVSPEFIESLNQRHRMRLPMPTRSHSGVAIPPSQKGDDMPEGKEDQSPLTMSQFADIRLLLAQAGRKADEDMVEAVRALTTEVAETRGFKADAEKVPALEKRVAELGPLADDGKKYRDSLVLDALKEGRRAHGEEFAEETYRGLLEHASIESVIRMRDDFKRTADKELPAGRATSDTSDDAAKKAAPKINKPIAAHSS